MSLLFFDNSEDYNDFPDYQKALEYLKIYDYDNAEKYNLLELNTHHYSNSYCDLAIIYSEINKPTPIIEEYYNKALLHIDDGNISNRDKGLIYYNVSSFYRNNQKTW